MTTRLALIALLVVGCTCSEPEAPLATGAPTPPTSVAPAPSVVTAPPPATHVPPTPEAIARMRTELAEGRRLAHSGDAAGALPHFQAALEAAPNPRARCEAGYVAHQAGQAETAQTLVTQALRELPDAEHVSDDLRVPLAMCFYNAGLVFEAAGDRDGAASAFGRSLALRENATVRTALARVGGTAPDEATPTTGTLAAMIDAQRAAWCESVGIECPAECAERATASEDDGTCRTMALGAGAIAGTPGFEAVLFEGSSFDGGVVGLVLGAGDARTWVELAESTRPGAEMGSSDAYEIGTMSWQDVIPGGPTELVIELHLTGLSHQAYDDDDGSYCDDLENDDWGTTVICASADGTVACTSVTRSEHGSTSHSCYLPDSEDEAPGATHQATEWALDLRFENGQAVLTARTPFSSSAENAAEERTGYDARLGSHDVAALLRDHPCDPICPI